MFGSWREILVLRNLRVYFLMSLLLTDVPRIVIRNLVYLLKTLCSLVHIHILFIHIDESSVHYQSAKFKNEKDKNNKKPSSFKSQSALKIH